MYALFPDTLDYGFRLARVEWIGGETAGRAGSLFVEKPRLKVLWLALPFDVFEVVFPP